MHCPNMKNGREIKQLTLPFHWQSLTSFWKENKDTQYLATYPKRSYSIYPHMHLNICLTHLLNWLCEGGTCPKVLQHPVVMLLLKNQSLIVVSFRLSDQYLWPATCAKYWSGYCKDDYVDGWKVKIYWIAAKVASEPSSPRKIVFCVCTMAYT